MKTTEIYNDCFSLFGIEHGMFGLLEHNKSRWATVSLYRDKSGSEFSASDLDVLKYLAPHLQRAFRLHIRFSELRSRSERFEVIPFEEARFR
jgi:hypothetical protein